MPASARISSSSALLALPRAWKCRPACVADRARRRAFSSLDSGMAEEECLTHSGSTVLCFFLLSQNRHIHNLTRRQQQAAAEAVGSSREQ